MKYKIVREEYIFDENIKERFWVMYEHKPWWSKKPRWKYCREFTYASYDSWRGEPVIRDTLEKAEQYIKAKFLAMNLKQEDIKIYECRDSKLNQLLK